MRRVIRLSYNLNDSFQKNKYHLIQFTLVVSCLIVAFLSTSSEDLKELTIILYARYDFNFCAKGEAYWGNSWLVSGYAREVKNGFVTFSFNWKDSRHSYEMVKRNTDSEQSHIFLKDSEVTHIPWAWRSRETRDSCLASLPLHALRVGQRQDTLLLKRYKRFNGYLDYLKTFIYMVKICL